MTEQTNQTTEQTPTPEEEVDDILERGGPWIMLTFTSEDGTFQMGRNLRLEEAEDLYAQLGVEIADAKSKYNITGEDNG
jgi:hypothetical protein